MPSSRTTLYLLDADFLRVGEIASRWSRDRSAPGDEDSFCAFLLSEFWDGALEGSCKPNQTLLSRRAALRALRSTEPHPAITIHETVQAVPPKITTLANGLIEFEFEAHILLPPDETDWTDGIIEQACAVLSEVDIDSYSGDFRVGFRCQEISRAQLAECCDRNGYPRPNFWFAKVGRADRKVTAAAKTRCRNWLRQQCKNEKRGPKQLYVEEAMRKFEGLSKRAFNDVWDECVPPSWKQEGAPSGPSGHKNYSR